MNIDLSLTLFENFYNINKLHPSFKPIFYQGKAISYYTVFQKVNSLAHFYQSLGIKEGDFITIVSPNIPEALYCFLAGEMLGIKIHLLHPLSGKNNVLEELKDKNSKLLITLDIFSKKYDEIIKEFDTLLISPADSLNFFIKKAFKLANIKLMGKEKAYLYSKIPTFPKLVNINRYDNKKGSVYLSSGGTTGKSKTIELSDYAILSLINQTNNIMSKDQIDGNYMLSPLPMFHGFGLVMGTLTPLFFNARINMVPQFHTKPVIKEIKKNRAHVLIGVPLIYEALLSKKEFSGDLLKNLKACFVGGDFISPSLLERFNDHLRKYGSSCSLFEGYGLTETVTVSNVNTIFNHKDHSIGKPLPVVKNYIIDENDNILPEGQIGEICLGGDTLMNGYYKEANSPFIYLNNEKCVKTGDLGYIDSDGYLYFVSRIKNVIIYKGYNIYPLGIEKMISTIKYINEVSYLEYQEKLITFVSLRDKTVPFNKIKEDIESLISLNFAEYMIPHKIIVIDSFPHTNVGKIDIKALKASLEK